MPRRRRWSLVGAGVACALLACGAAAQSTGSPAAGAKPGASRTAKGAAPRPGAAGSAAETGASAYAQRFASLCAACHGANGRSEMAGTPALAGQHGFYAITQLFLFREGRRSNEAMTAVAKTMKDDDMRGFAARGCRWMRPRRRRNRFPTRQDPAPRGRRNRRSKSNSQLARVPRRRKRLSNPWLMRRKTLRG